MVSHVFGWLCLICGHVRRPPIGGSAFSKVMYGARVASPSTTALAVVLVVSFYSMSMPCVI